MAILKWTLLVVVVFAAIVGVIALMGASLPVKHTATRTVHSNASPQQVWELISGPQTWRPDVTRYQELPPQNGKRVWIEYGKGDSKMTYEVVESDPPQKLVTRIADPHLPFGGTWTYQIAASPEGGTTLTITENGEVYNPLFRFVSRYVLGYTATMDHYLQALQTKTSGAPR
jgi:hypothetical protein